MEGSIDSNEEEIEGIKSDLNNKCPKCNKNFQKTSIPLINSLLSEILFKCPYYSNGCS